MKVVLKKTMIDRIVEAQRDAEAAGREIDRIELTRNEALQLRVDMHIVAPPPRLGFLGTVCGVRVFVVKDEDL